MTFAPYYDDGTVTIYHSEVEDLALDDLGGCCAAVVTSPPYNVGLGYDDDPTGDALGWEAYGDLTTTAVEAMAWALVPGGRAWVNTAVSVPLAIGGEGRKRRVLLGTWWANALASGGLELVDQVAWASVRGPGTAWGSWQSPSSPNLRGDYEVVTVACKGGWERQAPAGVEGWRDTAGGWESLCSTVWNVCTVGGNGRNSARKAHPAFAVEDLDALAERIGDVRWDDELPGVRRFYAHDPFGNRLEFLAAS